MNKKKLLYGALVPLLAVVLVSAAVLTFYGAVIRDVTVGAALLVNGEDGEYTDIYTDSINGGESVTANFLVESQTSVNVPISIVTTTNGNLNEAGVTHTINYLLDNSLGNCAAPYTECEKRIYIAAEDVAITDLDSLHSISWDADTIEGYVSHIDVLVDTDGDGIKDDALVFEYAKMVPSNCEVTPYPLGDISMSIDDADYAWLSSGAPGPGCIAVGNFYTNSLSNWKSGYQGIDGTTKVIGFELEVDNWITSSNSIIKNLEINGNPVEVTIKPNDVLAFNVNTLFDVTIVPGDYTVETQVQSR